MNCESNVSLESDASDRCSGDSAVESGMFEHLSDTSSIRYPEIPLGGIDAQDALSSYEKQDQDPDQGMPRWSLSTPPTFADFVEASFIPEFVATKRYAGRAHFRAILKHVLPPERVAHAFGASQARNKNTLKAISGWPYIDRLRLSEITPEVIQDLTSAALSRGYSIQTATHIRNVIRSIFAHAIRTGCYEGMNPASTVALPPMARRQTTALSFGQLIDLLQSMRHPEREVALFLMLTELKVAEICGIQWRYVNTSTIGKMIGEEFIPPRTIAVRALTYRGELSSITGKRRRFTRIPVLLSSIIHEIRGNSRFTLPTDFVLVSRNGSPIRPENIVARRLKPIGRSFNLPSLSWSVFNQTKIQLRSQIGRTFDEELKSCLFDRNLAAGR